VVGLTAVYFTSDQATRSRQQGQATPDDAFVDNGIGPFNAFMSSVIYGTSNSGQGLVNSLRGLDLMTLMYSQVTGSTTAWDGVGSFDEAAVTAGVNRRF